MDIDIDFKNREDALRIIKHIPASIYDGITYKKHNTGIYCTNIPHNPFTGLSTIDYKEAEARGYFKIDFLNIGIYDGVKNRKHLIDLMNKEPIWDLLEHNDFTKLLYHVKDHGTILQKMKPRSVCQLAAVLAIIRPAKKYLIGKDWETIMKEIWVPPTNDQYYYKKSHAISYAIAIIVQMNLICEQIETGEFQI